MLRNVVWLVLLSILASAPASAGRVELLTKTATPGPARAVGTTGGYHASADGRFVAFSSSSPNLVDGQVDGNNGGDIFLWDRNSGEVRLVSHRTGAPARAAQGSSSFHVPRISADGRWVAFCHSGTDLIPGQQPTIWDWDQVYLYDRLSETVTLVSRSVASPSRGGDYDSCSQSGLALSSDGRYLAFQSGAGDLISPQVPFGGDSLYLYDRVTSQLTLVSHAAGNPTQRSNGGVGIWHSLSADGRWITYTSPSTDLVAGVTDGNNDEDVFLFDRTSGVNVLVSHAGGSSTTTADRECYRPEISADGAWIAFSSGSTNLVASQADMNFGPDVFLWERATGTNRLVSHLDGSGTTTGDNTSGLDLAISADGSRIAYSSYASDLVTGVTEAPDTSDVFLFDRSTGTNTLVSRATGAAVAVHGSFPVLSADGARVVFSSSATNLVAGVTDANGASDVFAWEQASGNVTLLSHAQGSSSTAGNGGTSGGFLSADGLSLVFSSSASDLANGDSNERSDLFSHGLGSGVNLPISFNPMVVVGSGSGLSENLYRQVVSTDGRFIVFQSTATDLVAGQVDVNSSEFFGGRDVFLHDRQTGLTTLVSHSAGSATTTANDDSSYVNMSRDGRYLVFLSYANDLVPGQISGEELFLFDRLTGTNTMISHQPGSTTTGFCFDCEFFQISEDGRYIAFLNGTLLYLYERETDTLTPIHPGAQVTGLALSTGGRYLAFVSNATGIVPGQSDSNGGEDVFLYDRITGATTLVSRSASSPTLTGNAAVHGLTEVSADGRFVMFTSGASNHVPGQVDTNNGGDLFLFDRTTGNVSLVSHAAGSLTTAANGSTFVGSISRDGRFVAFASVGTNLVSGQQANALGGAYLYDHLSGNISLVSHLAGSLTESGGGTIPVISGDGSRVSFVSRSAGLIPGLEDENGSADVFLYDRSSGSLELVSRTLASPGRTGNAAVQLRTAVSEDGRVVVFSSGAGDLVADDYNLDQDVFAFVPEDLDFYTVEPCRLFDSRRPEDGPALNSGFATVVELDGACGLPDTAKAVAANITVVQPGTSGHLTVYPGDGLPPLASSLNFSAGKTLANNAVVRLAPSGNGTLAIRPMLAGGGSVHVVVDVIGYFE